VAYKLISNRHAYAAETPAPMTRATGEAYRCEQCKKQFATKDGLATHKQNKHPETPKRSMERNIGLLTARTQTSM
jgi:hypothetical protein